MTDLPDTLRTAVAVTRAHAHGDEEALEVLLNALPIEQVPSLLAALTTLVIVAQASPPGPLDGFLNAYLADVIRAEVIAAELAERQRDDDAEPDEG